MMRRGAWRDPFGLSIVDRWPWLWRLRRMRCRWMEWREGLL
jgi:hypothetical protein